MPDTTVEARLRELLRAPGGCALLIKMARAGMSPAEAVEPETSIHLVANAVGELNPWTSTHDAMLERLLRVGQEHIDLARALLGQPGIERWWAPLDRDNQVWTQPWADAEFPSPDVFPTPSQPPDRFEHYTQHPTMHITTSTRVGEWTSQLATCVSGETDWVLDYPAQRRRVRISPEARVCEIVTAEDWHTMVARHGTRSTPDMTFHPGSHDVPWGANDGLIPDWHAIAGAWEGVHITLWAYLTATQVRIASDAGWSEMWTRDGEETTWLRWVFDAIEDLSPVDPIPGGQQWLLPFRIPNPYGVYIRELP